MKDWHARERLLNHWIDSSDIYYEMEDLVRGEVEVMKLKKIWASCQKRRRSCCHCWKVASKR